MRPIYAMISLTVFATIFCSGAAAADSYSTVLNGNEYIVMSTSCEGPTVFKTILLKLKGEEEYTAEFASADQCRAFLEVTEENLGRAKKEEGTGLQVNVTGEGKLLSTKFLAPDAAKAARSSGRVVKCEFFQDAGFDNQIKLEAFGCAPGLVTRVLNCEEAGLPFSTAAICKPQEDANTCWSGTNAAVEAKPEKKAE